jgi:hypothetical protein
VGESAVSNKPTPVSVWRPGGGDAVLLSEELIALRAAVSCMQESYPHASGLVDAYSALRKLGMEPPTPPQPETTDPHGEGDAF